MTLPSTKVKEIWNVDIFEIVEGPNMPLNKTVPKSYLTDVIWIWEKSENLDHPRPSPISYNLNLE